MTFSDIVRNYFIPIVILCTLVFLVVMTIKDYKYRMFDKLFYMVAFYPIIFYSNYLITRNLLATAIGFSFLFMVFYITEIINPQEGIGTADILIAPFFTVWLNGYSLYYTLLFLAIYLIATIPYVNKKLINRNKDTKSIPLIPLMMVAFVISITVFPNNIWIFFNTF